MDDGQALALWQLRQQLGQVPSGLSRLLLAGGKQVAVILQPFVQRIVAGGTAIVVRQFIAGNGLHPGGQRLLRLVGVAGVVHGQQHLLQQVFDFAGALSKAP